MTILELMKTYEIDYRDCGFEPVGAPTIIEVHTDRHFVIVDFGFLYTTEANGRVFVESFLKRIFGSDYENIYIELDSWQEGEHKDDFITVSTKIKDKILGEEEQNTFCM